MTVKGVKRRPEERGPLPAPQPLLLLLAVSHDARVEAEAGVVYEHPAVDLAHVHLHDAPLHDVPGRLFDVERDLEVLGEVIEGPERQDAHHLFAPRQDGRDGADGPVPAAHDDDLSRAGGRLLRETQDVRAVLRPVEVHLHARVLAKGVAQALVDLTVLRASGGLVQDDRYGNTRRAGVHRSGECKTSARASGGYRPRVLRMRAR